ncbi:MAG: NAD(P)-dependent oxidoreductase, partial [Candidatus Entotheonellia bacterium]
MTTDDQGMRRARILVCDRIAPQGIDWLQKEPDLDVDVRPGLSADELRAAIGQYDGLIVRSRTKITAETLAGTTRLKVIGRAGIGVDNIDVAAATSVGVVVMNTPEGNTNTAAEHTLALLLALARNVSQGDASLKRGEWTPERYGGVELSGKVLGIIGLGRIGTLVAKKAQGLGMTTIAFDPFISREQAQNIGVEIFELAEVVGRADFLTVHTPKTRATTHLIGPTAFALMKPGVRLVNCARGG